MLARVRRLMEVGCGWDLASSCVPGCSYRVCTGGLHDEGHAAGMRRGGCYTRVVVTRSICGLLNAVSAESNRRSESSSAAEVAFRSLS